MNLKSELLYLLLIVNVLVIINTLRTSIVGLNTLLCRKKYEAEIITLSSYACETISIYDDKGFGVGTVSDFYKMPFQVKTETETETRLLDCHDFRNDTLTIWANCNLFRNNIDVNGQLIADRRYATPFYQCEITTRLKRCGGGPKLIRTSFLYSLSLWIIILFVLLLYRIPVLNVTFNYLIGEFLSKFMPYKRLCNPISNKIVLSNYYTVLVNDTLQGSSVNLSNLDVPDEGFFNFINDETVIQLSWFKIGSRTKIKIYYKKISINKEQNFQICGNCKKVRFFIQLIQKACIDEKYWPSIESNSGRHYMKIEEVLEGIFDKNLNKINIFYMDHSEYILGEVYPASLIYKGNFKYLKNIAHKINNSVSEINERNVSLVNHLIKYFEIVDKSIANVDAILYLIKNDAISFRNYVSYKTSHKKRILSDCKEIFRNFGLRLSNVNNYEKSEDYLNYLKVIGDESPDYAFRKAELKQDQLMEVKQEMLSLVESLKKKGDDLSQEKDEVKAVNSEPKILFGNVEEFLCKSKLSDDECGVLRFIDLTNTQDVDHLGNLKTKVDKAKVGTARHKDCLQVYEVYKETYEKNAEKIERLKPIITSEETLNRIVNKSRDIIQDCEKMLLNPKLELVNKDTGKEVKTVKEKDNSFVENIDENLLIKADQIYRKIGNNSLDFIEKISSICDNIEKINFVKEMNKNNKKKKKKIGNFPNVRLLLLNNLIKKKRSGFKNEKVDFLLKYSIIKAAVPKLGVNKLYNNKHIKYDLGLKKSKVNFLSKMIRHLLGSKKEEEDGKDIKTRTKKLEIEKYSKYKERLKLEIEKHNEFIKNLRRLVTVFNNLLDKDKRDLESGEKVRQKSVLIYRQKNFTKLDINKIF